MAFAFLLLDFPWLWVLLLLVLEVGRRWWRSSTIPSVYVGNNAHTQSLLSRLPALEMRYVPPIWCFSWWAQLVALGLLEPFRPRSGIEYDMEVMVRSDGGEIAIAWAQCAGLVLPDDAPVLCLFPTMTASPATESIRRLCGHAIRRGLRPVVCFRRGHLDAPLKSARFHTMGCIQDTKDQIQRAQERYPKAHCVGLAISAGNGVMVRLLGEVGLDTPLRGAACICPGFDVARGQMFKKMWPVVQQPMLSTLRGFWLTGQHAEVLKAAAAKDVRLQAALDEAMLATDLEKFYEAISPFAGFESTDAMYTGTNPFPDAYNIKVPGLVIAARDDPICTMAPEFIGTKMFAGNGPVALALTQTGTHCAFFEGFLGWSVLSGGENWSETLALDFIGEVLRDLRANQHRQADVFHEDTGAQAERLPAHVESEHVEAEHLPTLLQQRTNKPRTSDSKATRALAGAILRKFPSTSDKHGSPQPGRMRSRMVACFSNF